MSLWRKYPRGRAQCSSGLRRECLLRVRATYIVINHDRENALSQGDKVNFRPRFADKIIARRVHERAVFVHAVQF